MKDVDCIKQNLVWIPDNERRRARSLSVVIGGFAGVNIGIVSARFGED